MSRKYYPEQRPPQSSGEYLFMVRGDKPTENDWRLLLDEMHKLPDEVADSLQKLIGMRREDRLASQLVITAKRLAGNKVTTVIPGGVLPRELMVLDRLCVLSTRAQVAAWSLFNLHARQRLIQLYLEALYG